MQPSVPLLARALAKSVPEGTESILDAALELAGASGLKHVTMDEVARRAGVGRMTVYRRFGTRDALIEALIARETRRSLAHLEAAAPVDAPVVDQMALSVAAAAVLVREHPLLSRLPRTEPETVVGHFSADGGALMHLCVTFLVDRLERAGADLAAPLDEVAELVVRLLVSYVLLPEGVMTLEDPERVRALLGPLLQTRTAP